MHCLIKWIIIFCFIISFGHKSQAQEPYNTPTMNLLLAKGNYTMKIDSIIFIENNRNKYKEKFQYSFDINNKLIFFRKYQWDTMQLSYNLISIYKYEHLNDSIVDYYSDTSELFTLSNKYKMSYKRNNKIHSYHLSKWEASKWSLFYKVDTFLNSLNKPDSIITSLWNDTLGLFQKIDYINYEYESNNEILSTYTTIFNVKKYIKKYYDTDNKWIELVFGTKNKTDTNYIERLYYDKFGNLDSVQYYNVIRTHSNVTIVPQVNSYTKYTYDTNIKIENVLFDYSSEYFGSPFQNMVLMENLSNIQYPNYDQRIFFYSKITSYSNIICQNNAMSSIYPNPSEGYIMHSHKEKLGVKILDIYGRTIIYNRISNTEKLELNHLTNGFYIYQIYNLNSEMIESGKIEIIHPF